MQQLLAEETASKQSHEANSKKLDASLKEITDKLDTESKNRFALEKAKKAVEAQLATVSGEVDSERKAKVRLFFLSSFFPPRLFAPIHAWRTHILTAIFYLIFRKPSTRSASLLRTPLRR